MWTMLDNNGCSSITDNKKLYVTIRSIINFKPCEKMYTNYRYNEKCHKFCLKIQNNFWYCIRVLHSGWGAYCKNVNLVVLSIDSQEWTFIKFLISYNHEVLYMIQVGLDR